MVPKSWIRDIVVRFARQDVMMVIGSVLPYSLSNSAETGFEDMCGFPSTYTTKEATGSTFRDEPSFHLASLGVGANMSFRSRILESPDIGDMCEIFGAGAPTGGGEDAEFIYRILKEGLTVIFDPSIWVHHRHRRSASDLHRQLFGYGKSNSALYLHLLFTHKDFRSLYWLLFNIPYSLLMLMYRSDYRRLWLTVFRGYFCGFPAYFWSIIKDREYSRKIDSVQRAVPSPKQLK